MARDPLANLAGVSENVTTPRIYPILDAPLHRAQVVHRKCVFLDHLPCKVSHINAEIGQPLDQNQSEIFTCSSLWRITLPNVGRARKRSVSFFLTTKHRWKKETLDPRTISSPDWVYRVINTTLFLEMMLFIPWSLSFCVFKGWILWLLGKSFLLTLHRNVLKRNSEIFYMRYPVNSQNNKYK